MPLAGDVAHVPLKKCFIYWVTMGKATLLVLLQSSLQTLFLSFEAFALYPACTSSYGHTMCMSTLTQICIQPVLTLPIANNLSVLSRGQCAQRRTCYYMVSFTRGYLQLHWRTVLCCTLQINEYLLLQLQLQAPGVRTTIMLTMSGCLCRGSGQVVMNVERAY